MCLSELDNLFGLSRLSDISDKLSYEMSVELHARAPLGINVDISVLQTGRVPGNRPNPGLGAG
jgi:hypothetical protein